MPHCHDFTPLGHEHEATAYAHICPRCRGDRRYPAARTTCGCESSHCDHDQPCSRPTSTNTAELGQMCSHCLEHYATGPYPLTLTERV